MREKLNLSIKFVQENAKAITSDVSQNVSIVYISCVTCVIKLLYIKTDFNISKSAAHKLIKNSVQFFITKKKNLLYFQTNFASKGSDVSFPQNTALIGRNFVNTMKFYTRRILLNSCNTFYTNTANLISFSPARIMREEPDNSILSQECDVVMMFPSGASDETLMWLLGRLRAGTPGLIVHVRHHASSDSYGFYLTAPFSV